MTEVQTADRRTRRVALAVVGAGALVGAALLAVAEAVRPSFETWVMQDVPARVRLTMVAMIVLTTGPILACAAYLWRLGQRTVIAQRYPPPGLRLVKDVRVLTGEAAGRRGRFIQGSATALGLVGLLLALVLWRFAALAARSVS